VTLPGGSHHDSQRALLVTQAVFFCALAVCVALNHTRAAQTNGISYFAVNHRTVPFISVGFLAAGAGLWRVATLNQRRGDSSFSVYVTRLIALDAILVLVTPYKYGTILNWTHMSAGVIGAFLQIGFLLYWMKFRRSTWLAVGLSVQLLGGVISFLSMPDWSFDQLLFGETIFQVGFCLGFVTANRQSGDTG
jgi:hypothetical protein